MSDPQDDIILRQRQMQQRQILAMMGVEQWIQPDSPTLRMANIPAAESASDVVINTLINNPSLEAQQPTAPHPVSTNLYADESYSGSHVAVTQYNPSASDDINRNDSDNDSMGSADHPAMPISTDETEEKTHSHVLTPAVTQVIEPLVDKFAAQAVSDSQLTVAPFDLQGGRYGNWVLMVDIQALNNDSQKLWQNMTQALSFSCETTSFPICAGMDTAELANASLAGYIFKIGRSEEMLVAALTELPDGLTHPNLSSVPTLDEMLADSTLKGVLWEQLVNQV